MTFLDRRLSKPWMQLIDHAHNCFKNNFYITRHKNLNVFNKIQNKNKNYSLNKEFKEITIKLYNKICENMNECIPLWMTIAF